MRPHKREQLLTPAERLFFGEGFHATGINGGVAEADIARTMRFNHFPSKEALTEAAFKRRARRCAHTRRSAINRRGRTSPVTALVEHHGWWLRSGSRDGCVVSKAFA